MKRVDIPAEADIERLQRSEIFNAFCKIFDPHIRKIFTPIKIMTWMKRNFY